jgi:hypothetical protein
MNTPHQGGRIRPPWCYYCPLAIPTGGRRGSAPVKGSAPRTRLERARQKDSHALGMSDVAWSQGLACQLLGRGTGRILARKVGESLIGRPPPTEFSFNGSLAFGGQFHCMRKRTRRDRSTRQSARPWGGQDESRRRRGGPWRTRGRRPSIVFWHVASLLSNIPSPELFECTKEPPPPGPNRAPVRVRAIATTPTQASQSGRRPDGPRGHTRSPMSGIHRMHLP